MTQQEAWKQGQDWWIRSPEGAPVNLNTRQGATMVLELQQQLAQLEATKGSRRKKVGPSETKG